MSSTMERRRFAIGESRYVGDLFADATLQVAFVRSPVARGRIVSVDLSAARSGDGVVGAFAARDADIAPTEVRFGPGKSYAWHPLCAEQVSYVGEPIAVIAAATRARAEEAVDAAVVDIEPSTPVLDPVAALAGGAPAVRPESPDNLAFEIRHRSGEAEAALAASDVVVETHVHLGRLSACPLETRGVVAWEEDATGQLVIVTSTQIPHLVRKAVASALGRPEQSVRVVCPDVGGAFGLKAQVYAEELVIAWLATRLHRRVGWIEDRWENLAASCHGHDEAITLRAGFDHHGVIQSVVADVLVDVGAHSVFPFSTALQPSTVVGHLFGCYKVPAVSVRAVAAFTNKPPVGAYRGVGAPAATFAQERLLDQAAWQLGLSRTELRRRNIIGSSDMPYQHALGYDYHGAAPLALFDAAVRRAAEFGLATLDHAGLAGADQEVVTGIGVAVFNEHSSPGSSVYRSRGVDEIPGYDSARLVLERDGSITVYLSSADAGQDHVETCQLEVARLLRVDRRAIRVVEGDTQVCPPGTGTFASRFAVAHIGSVLSAADGLRERVMRLVASLTGTAADDLVQAEGGFATRDGSMRIGWAELARRGYSGDAHDPDLRFPIEATGVWNGDTEHPWGVVYAEVELDQRLLLVRVKDVVMIEDCGRVLNLASVVDQLRGGIVMGLGNALYEEHHYSEFGDPLTASFLDYLLPVADAVPRIHIDVIANALDTTTVGKGVGEAGTIGAFAAIGAAIADAVHSLGGDLNELPASPNRLFAAIYEDR